MAYGTPERPEDVPAYFTHIRGGRAPSAAAVRHLQERYEAVGGRTPLLDITNAVRDELDRRLNSPATEPYRVYVGMKHWHPYIADVVPAIMADGVSELTAIALAPHYSRMSIGMYQRAVEDAIARATVAQPLAVRFVKSWHLHPDFVGFMAERVTRSLEEWPARMREQVVTLFSAHSLPERIREWNDPYEQQMLDGCAAVARAAGLDNWRIVWQSAGDTGGGEPWIGPDIVDALETLRAGGAREVLSVPIGFVSDHLEILYDIDRAAKQRAESLGMTLRRTPMPNADPAFVNVLAAVVREHAMAEAG